MTDLINNETLAYLIRERGTGEAGYKTSKRGHRCLDATLLARHRDLDARIARLIAAGCVVEAPVTTVAVQPVRQAVRHNPNGFCRVCGDEFCYQDTSRVVSEVF